MSDATLVALRGVSKRYRGPAGRASVLEDVDLTLRRGEKASLVGPSGCGKSTLLALICGLLLPSAGSVEFDGAPLAGLDDADRARIRADRIGIALQSDNLIPFLTAAENVELALRLGQRASRRWCRRRASELLDGFGIGDRRHHRPRELSGGEAQRVALAVAIANEPDLLLADEVVAQLDGDTAADVMGDVMDAGFAVVLVTHDEALAAAMPTRYAIAERRVVRR